MSDSTPIATRRFDSLPERPPTPPRDISKDVDDALRFLRDGHDETSLQSPPKSELWAVEQSQNQSPPITSSGDTTTAKKVGFSTNHTYHDVPKFGLFSSPITDTLRSTPVTRSTKPLRSILKPPHGQPPHSPEDLDSVLNSFSPQEPGSFKKMLNAVIQGLGQHARAGRLDAYLALNGALKTFDGIPDPEAILDKRNLLVQFMARDMAWKDSEGRTDRDIVTQALHLASALMFNARTASALDEEFRSFIIDRSILVLEQPEMPKAVIKGHMLLLCQSRLHASITTSSRTEKLVSALQTIHERCSGNSIFPARLIIYQRLIEQAPAAMLNRMRDWIELIFNGLLSSMKEVRSRALETFTTAGLSLGTHQQASKTLNDLFDRAIEEGQTYGEYVNQRLREMIEDSDLAPFVPQVWAGVIFFLRSKRTPIDKWPSLRGWFMTLQKCLNSGDIAIRQQAHIAWNKLVFSVMPDSISSDSFRAMLKVPIVAGLKVRGKDRHSQEQRFLARNSYCNLLHYALRPGLSYDNIDMAWDLYVHDVLSSMSVSSSKGRQYACSVLQGLLSKNEGIWNVNAAIELKVIKPEELSRIDPRWLRSRFGRVVKLIEPILTVTMGTRTEGDDCVERSWQSLMIAVAEAGSQEVKTSNEVKEVVAQVTNLFRRIWSTSLSLSSDAQITLWVQRYRHLLVTAIDSLGAGHFVQDFLTLTSTNEVEAALTPSNRVSKHPTPVESSIVLLLALHCESASPALHMNESYRLLAARVLDSVINTKASVAVNLSLMQSALRYCRSSYPPEKIVDAYPSLWTAVADRAAVMLGAQSVTSPVRDGQVVGGALRAGVQIMQQGFLMMSDSEDCCHGAVRLSGSMSTAALRAGGEGGLVTAVTEPIAKALVDAAATVPLVSLLKSTSALLDHTKWPSSRSMLDQGRKAFWLHSLDLPKNSAFDPFEHVYSLLNLALVRAYEHGDPSEGTCGLLESLSRFLHACPLTILASALKNMQRGLVPWINDEKRLLSSLQTTAFNDVIRRHMLEIWVQVLDSIKSLPRKEPSLLQSIEQLLVAGFSSHSRAIVNKTITFWNSTFGNEITLIYPSRLQAVLHARSLQTEIYLPGFPEKTDCIGSMELPPLEESPVKAFELPQGFSSAGITPKLLYLLRQPEAENTLIKQHMSQRELSRNSKAKSPRAAELPSPMPRLRHDDSQIEFAPIEALSQDKEHDGQLLTDHQLEVKSRQQEDAMIFPVMSSSPLHTSTRASKAMLKRLDLAADVVQVHDPELLGTPNADGDGNPMSDDLPSSPTPRANTHHSSAPVFNDEGEEEEGEEPQDCDIPSSPPRRINRSEKDVGPHNGDDAQEGGQEPQTESISAGTSAIDPTWSDSPADNLLPTAQLHREEAAAEAKDQASSLMPPPKKVKRITAPSVVQEDMGRPSLETDAESHASSRASSVSHVIESSAAHEQDTKYAASQRDGRSGKKRKRASGIIYTARKRKQQSPLKRIISNIFGQTQEDDEEDIGDEIIVASSQSPATSFHAPTENTQQSAVFEVEESDIKQTTEEALDGPIKRGRGRPRKTLATIDANAGPLRTSRKRSASAMSEAVTDRRLESDQEESEIKRQCEGDETMIIRDSQRSPKVSHLHRAAQTSQVPSSVELEQPVDSEIDNIKVDDLHPERTQDGSNDRSLEDVGVNAAVERRKIAQPVSLLGRLRGMLAECKSIILGSQEEREFDDVLFQMRQEIHEAGRRGRSGL